MSDLQPGPATPNTPVMNEYEENAYAMSGGQRLYTAFTRPSPPPRAS
ncbi:MAG: hypothetical protein ACM359_12530 [Bacillota bacterium]